MGDILQVADVCLVIPTVNPETTPHSEAFQAVIWHLLVSHPALKANQTNGNLNHLNIQTMKAVFWIEMVSLMKLL